MGGGRVYEREGCEWGIRESWAEIRGKCPSTGFPNLESRDCLGNLACVCMFPQRSPDLQICDPKKSWESLQIAIPNDIPAKAETVL